MTRLGPPSSFLWPIFDDDDDGDDDSIPLSSSFPESALVMNGGFASATP
jgi:hypothetical protein